MVPNPSPQGKSRFSAYMALLVSTIIASGTFLVAKGTTKVFDPFDLGWFRINLSAFIIFVLYCTLNRRWPMRPNPQDLGRFALLGLLGVTANQLLFLKAMQYAPAIDGALLYAFTPVLVLVLARFFVPEKLTWTKVWGIGLAVIGVVAVLQERGLRLSSETFRGDLLLMVAVLAWAGYTLLGKSLMARYGALTVNTWAFMAGALSILPFSGYVLVGFDWQAPGWEGWLGLGYLSLMTSVVAFTLWTWSLKKLEASQAAVFTNLNPAMTVLLVWLFHHQPPSGTEIFGVVMVVAGITLTQRQGSGVSALPEAKNNPA